MTSDGTAVIDPGGLDGATHPGTPLNIEAVTFPAPGIRRVTAIVTKEGVFKGVYRDPAPLESAAKNVPGVMWFIGHPEPGTEDGCQSRSIGEVIQSSFVPGVNKLRVVSDFYEDRLDEDIIRRLDNKDPIEVSVGYRASLVHEDGNWRGQIYGARETGLEITHIAIVPAGACSWKDGCGLGLHDEVGNIDELTDEQLTTYFDHQVERLVSLSDAGCDQTARFHCRHDLARTIDASKRRETNPLLHSGRLNVRGGDERIQAAIQEAKDWFGKFYGNHSLDDSSIEERGGMTETKEDKGAGGGTSGEGGSDLIEIGSAAQLETYLNQVTKTEDVGAKVALATKVLERILSDAKAGKGLFAKPKEEPKKSETKEGQHSAEDAGEDASQIKKVYLKPVVTIEGGHDDEPGDIASVTFEETESESEVKNAVAELVADRNAKAKEAAESEKTLTNIKDQLAASEDAKAAAEAKIRESLIARLLALPGMDDEMIKVYDEMDNSTLEKIVSGMERIHGTSTGVGGAEAGEHSAARQKTPLSVPDTKNNKPADSYEKDFAEYERMLGRG